MEVKGVVINAEDHSLVAGARIALKVDERELAVLYTDSEGKMSYIDTTSCFGKTLVCVVEKEGFKNAIERRLIEEDEVSIRVELVPLATEKSTVMQSVEAAAGNQNPEKGSMEIDVKLQLHFKNKQGMPMSNVVVTCELPGFKVGHGISDNDGLVQLFLARLKEP